jgi:hypothetical protein
MRCDRGSLLIAALWSMSIFSVMTTSLVFGASQQVVVMKRELRDFQDKADLLSGLNEIYSVISADSYPHEDSTHDLWFGRVALRPDFSERFSAYVEDEESKININEVSERFLNVFLKVLEDHGAELRGSRKDYAKEILKLRAQKRIQSLEEILLIENFEEEDFEVLRPYLTVYSDSGLVNINTAKALVISSIIQAIPGDQGTKQLFIGRLTEACGVGADGDAQQCYFLSSELQPSLFIQKLHLPGTPLMAMLVQEFLSKVTTDSETFRLVMKTKSSKEAEAVFRFRSGQSRPEVFYWHES